MVWLWSCQPKVSYFLKVIKKMESIMKTQREMPPFGPHSCRVGPVSAPTRHERGTNAARMREEREIMRETARQTRPERGTNEGGTRNAARTREERGARHERGRNEERGTNAARTRAFLSVFLPRFFWASE